MSKSILILGLGEIGSAIREVETDANNNVSIIELEYTENLRDDDRYDVCHVCIPYVDFETYNTSVCAALRHITCDVVIFHSTVEVGTTRKLHDNLQLPCVHSFVRGVHPNLKSGLLTFEKPIGSLCILSEQMAHEHFESIGITPHIVKSPEVSELGKILDTTYYGYNILFAKYVNDMCVEYDLPYDEVYTWANKTYNKGYTELHMENVVRPVLYPPAAKIGGHCVVPNFKLMPEGKLKDWCLQNHE